MTDSQAKLKSLLRELFQLDNADLDFGIYRIMNAKRVEIERFLDNDLLPQVKKAFEQYQSSDSAGTKNELAKLVQQLTDAGVDPESSPKVKDLRAKLADAVDVSALESQVFSDLYNFFRRYYSEGDFLSLRRYKEGVYAIPYEGEEVKLYWANHDQYYIKSSEYLRDYRFKVAGGRVVHFKVVDADAEKDNVKAANGNERRFVLALENPIAEEHGELIIRFEFKPDAQKRKQEALNELAVAAILSANGFDSWHVPLSATHASASDPSRSTLAKHLSDYASLNTFDYFIHKNLGGFLRRELDFFIKNEVMHLDDIESAHTPKIEEIYSRIRILRQIAHKVISFLAQIEDFQKLLWLKKKFVVDLHWLVTIDRIPSGLREAVAGNKQQWHQWESLGFKPAEDDSLLISRPKWGTCDYLDAHQGLVVDTSLFDTSFTDTLLACPEVLAGKRTLDDAITGTLFHSENFQALSFIQARYRGEIQCIYADPPYNTDAGPIDYKNGYRSSSWMSLIENRLTATKALAQDNGNFCITIDDYQYKELAHLIAAVLGEDNYRATVPIRINPSGRATANGFSVCHEYALFFAASSKSTVGRLPRTAKQLDRFEVEEGIHVDWRNFRKDGGSVTHRIERPKQYYPLFVNEQDLAIRIPALAWNKNTTSWDVLEPQQDGEITVFPIDDKGRERIWSLGHETARAELVNLKAEMRDSKISVLRRHIPNDGVLPRTWWDRVEYAAREHGSAALTRFFGRPHSFLFPKAPVAVEDSLRILEGDAIGPLFVLDYFAGSGTTAQAVMNLNREDNSKGNQGERNFILVEMGEHFNSVLKPRVMKVIYSPDWKDGKAQSHDKGLSSLVKVLRLESYEDTLNNLRLKRTEGQQSLLEANPSAAEEYTLNYLLEVETKGSPSLLSIDAFTDPFNYTLNIATGTVGETRPTKVDLVETFNWLLGLRVKTIDTIKGVHVVTGTSPQGEKVLILWRNVNDMPSAKLDEFFQKQGYNTKDMEFDVIYVNGDNNLENLKKDEETWKVRLIEQDFKRLMFDVQDV